MNPARKAIEVLADRGWHKGGPVGPNKEVCMAMCIEVAIHSLALEKPFFEVEVRRMAREVIRENFGDRVENDVFPIPIFNDHKDTVIDDVITVLEKVAVKIDEQKGLS